MRAALVPIRALIVSVGVALSSGCAAARHGTPIGMSDAPAERSRPAKIDAPVLHASWPDFAAARAWPEASPPSVALAHRRDGAMIHVRVEPPGLTAYRQLSAEAPMPEGARVLAWHETPAGAPLGAYLLEKRGGAWSALELDASGAVVPGDRARCVRCHDMAPTDHLFGLRAAPPPAPAVTGESISPDRR